MLERIMNLQILLCIMAAAGAFGAVGMLAVHLTYRRTLRRTNACLLYTSDAADD